MPYRYKAGKLIGFYANTTGAEAEHFCCRTSQYPISNMKVAGGRITRISINVTFTTSLNPEISFFCAGFAKSLISIRGRLR
jgi:hypothetical protein